MQKCDRRRLSKKALYEARVSGQNLSLIIF